MIRWHRGFSHVLYQPWFINISVVRHRVFCYDSSCFYLNIQYSVIHRSRILATNIKINHVILSLCSRHSKFRKVNRTNFLILFWTFQFCGIWLRVLPARPVQPSIRSRIQCPPYAALFWGPKSSLHFVARYFSWFWRDVTISCGLVCATIKYEQSSHTMRS